MYRRLIVLIASVALLVGAGALAAPAHASASPVITSYSPDPIPTSGGVMTVYGFGLSDTFDVQVNAYPASFTVVSDTEIQVVAPSSSPGPGSLEVSTSSGGYTDTIIIYGGSSPQPGAPTGVVAPGLVVLSEDDAAGAVTRVMGHDAGESIGTALKVQAHTGEPVRLIAKVPASHTFTLKMKPNAGEYLVAGRGASTSKGQLSLPVFRATKAGTITLAMMDETTGRTHYVKVNVVKRQRPGSAPSQ